MDWSIGFLTIESPFIKRWQCVTMLNAEEQRLE